jgi:hypothetical protein
MKRVSIKAPPHRRGDDRARDTVAGLVADSVLAALRATTDRTPACSVASSPSCGRHSDREGRLVLPSGRDERQGRTAGD